MGAMEVNTIYITETRLPRFICAVMLQFPLIMHLTQVPLFLVKKQNMNETWWNMFLSILLILKRSHLHSKIPDEQQEATQTNVHPNPLMHLTVKSSVSRLSMKYSVKTEWKAEGQV